MFCLFDIAATGRTDIGLSTLVGSQTFDDIVALSTASKYFCTINCKMCASARVQVSTMYITIPSSYM